jgi:hypothetical protein
MEAIDGLFLDNRKLEKSSMAIIYQDSSLQIFFILQAIKKPSIRSFFVLEIGV